MQRTENAAIARARGPRRLSVVAGTRRPPDRDDAVRRVRDARRHLQARSERFAHLKRMYD